MADLSVSIIGMGRLGTSIGLGLKRYNNKPDSNNHFTIIGHDRFGKIERLAKTMGAIDEQATSIAAAVQDKDLVILTAPYAEMKDLYRDIAHDLRDGVVICDFSPLKTPSLQWEKDYLRDEVHVIGATAVVNPAYLWDGLDDTEHAAADYLDGGAMILSPSAQANRDALDLVTSLANVLGTTVHYMDPVEHDGLVAATEGVPALVSVALFRALSSTRGWSEVQRVTNPAFGRVTHRLMDTHPDDIRDLLMNNNENTVRYLDNLIDTLQGLRDVLADGDRDAVEAAVIGAEEGYADWIRRRSMGKWDDMLEQEQPKGASMLSGMLGGFLSDRLFGGGDDKGKNN